MLRGELEEGRGRRERIPASRRRERRRVEIERADVGIAVGFQVSEETRRLTARRGRRTSPRAPASRPCPSLRPCSSGTGLLERLAYEPLYYPASRPSCRRPLSRVARKNERASQRTPSDSLAETLRGDTHADYALDICSTTFKASSSRFAARARDRKMNVSLCGSSRAPRVPRPLPASARTHPIGSSSSSSSSSS